MRGSRATIQAWRAYAAAGALLLVPFALGPDVAWQRGLLALGGLLATAAAVLGVRLNRPARRRPWQLFTALTAAIASLVLMQFAAAVLPGAAHLYDLGFLLSVPLYPAGVGLFLWFDRCRLGRRDRGSFIDGLIVAGGLGTALWILVYADFFHSATVPRGIKSLLIVFPILDVVLIGATVRSVVGGGLVLPAYRLMVAGMAGNVAADLLLFAGALQPSPSLTLGSNAALLLAVLPWGATALHPSMRELTERQVPGERRLTGARLGLLAAAALLGPIVLAAQASRGTPVDLAAMLTVIAALFLLALVRVADLAGRLEQAETSEHALFAAHALPMWVYDRATLRMLDVNDAALTRYGYSREEFLALSITDIRPDEDCEAVLRAVDRAEALHTSGPWRHRARDGSVFEVEITSHLVEFEGRAARLVMAQDVTTRRQAELALAASEERYRSLVESTSDWIWATDASGIITYSNPAIREMLGYAPEEMVGRLGFDFMHPDDRRMAELDMPMRVALRRGWNARSLRWRHKDGGWRFFDSHGAPILDASGGIAGWRGIDRDVTARQRLEAELELQATVVRNMSEGVSLVRLEDESIVYCNPAFERMFGYASGEMIGLNVISLAYDDGSGRLAAEMAEIREQLVRRGTAEFEVESVRRDGHRLWSRVRTSLVDHPRFGRVAVAVQENVTGRRAAAEALRESERRFETLADAIPQIVWMAGPDGTVDYANQRAVHFSRRTSRDLIGTGWTASVHPEDLAPTLDAWMTAVRTGEVFEAECRFRRATDAAERWHLLRAVPVRGRDGRIRRWFGTGTDIEDQKRARVEAEAASRAKSEFLANMSHEVRTPLNGILGMTELLLEAPEAGRTEYLEVIRDSAQQLLAVVNDILDFSKVEARRLALDAQPFRVREVFPSIVRVFEVAARGKGLALSLEVAEDVPDRLTGDAGRLRQVVVNLLGNAVKFTEAGRVDVRLDHEVLPDGRVTLHGVVRDTGIGIPPERQEAIFSPFTQGDGATTRRYGGTGLGLAISSQLVALMGGRLWVESEVGRGSAFHFTACLGVAAPEVAEAEAPPAPARAGARALRVLLAEDNQVNRKLVTAILERRGHRVTPATNGREAVEYAARGDLDLVFIDIQMPEMDGFQATAAIRRAEEGTGRRLPIVALTAHALKGDREACLAAGMDDYVAKPVRIADILAIVRRMGGETELVGRSERRDEPAFDEGNLVARVEGDRALLSDVVALFEEESASLLADLRRGLAAGDAQAVARAAHALKGCAGNVGAGRVVTTAQALERVGQETRIEEARARFAALEREMETLRSALQQAVQPIA